MTSTIQVTLPGGRQIPFSYPASPLMDNVVRGIFLATDYPHLNFLSPTGAVILDIGANVGASAILFASQYPGATIYAFEPGRDAFTFLVQNTLALPNIRGFQFGAFDQDTTASLYHGRDGSYTSSLFAGGLASATPGETVLLRRVSNFLREHSISRVALLKIDTEGSELAILQDLAEFFPQIDAIHVEFHAERDRLAIDELLAPLFILYAGKINEPHRGVLTYVAKRLNGPGFPMDRMHINTRDSVG